jgi:hypothetical protein
VEIEASGLVSDRVHKSGALEMISLWGMLGKGIGFADRPLVRAVPRPREPMDRLASYAAVRFRAALGRRS